MSEETTVRLSGTAIQFSRSVATPRVLFGRIATVLATNGVYLAGGFLTNVLIANALAPAEFGYFSVAMAVMVIAQEMCGTGFDMAMVRLVARAAAENNGRARLLLRLSFRIKLLLNAAMALLLLLLSGWLARSVFAEPRLTFALRWAAVGVMGNALFQHVLARYQALERFRAFAVAKSIQGLVKVAMLFFLAAFGALNLNAALAASVLTLLIGFAIAIPGAQAAAGKGEQADAPGLWRHVLWFGRWMIAAHMLFSLYARLDVVLLSRLRDEAEVGYYTVAWNLGFMIDVCTYSMMTALMPHVSRMGSGDELCEYVRGTLRACALMAVLLLPTVMFARPLISVLFPAYGPAVGVFRILFCGCLLTLMTHPLYLIVYARDRMPLIALSNLVLVLVAAVACWLLIPRLGVIGAAYGTVLARAVNAGLITCVVYRELHT